MSLPPADVEQVRLLVRAQDAARVAALAQALAMAEAQTRNFTGWYSTAAIKSWAGSLAASIEAIQQSLARSTDAYLARLATLMTGRPVRPRGAIDVTALRQGVTHPGAYGRVADQYRYQTSRQQVPDVLRVVQRQPDAPKVVPPLEAAVSRALVVAEMDTQLAVRGQAQAFMESQRTITGYRRVIHPELSRSGTCGLCIAASDRLYGKRELMPIHARCNCLPMPVYDGADPGSTLNQDDMRRLYGEAGDTSREKLKRTRYKVTEHGELGPLLTAKGDPVRTAADVKRDERS